MHFLFNIKKTKKSKLNLDKLKNKNICAYPADNVGFFEGDNWELFVYSYNFEVKEEISEAVEQKESQLKVKLGIFSDKNEHAEIGKYFGDYLILKFDEEGNGELIRPAMSFIQCFIYEDNDSIVLSSEIGLIVSAVNSLCTISFEKKYDYKFIQDSIFNGLGTTNQPNNTVFKSISRVFPHQKLSFINSTVNIDINSKVFPRNSFLEDKYRSDKSEFYDFIFDSIINFLSDFFKDKTEAEVNLGLTGGLDSRCTLAFLREVERRTSIKIITNTSGPADHPDVVLAKKIANHLGLEHRHSGDKDIEGKQIILIPRSVDDYQSCFLISQGDWSSNNFRTTRQIERAYVLTGQDNFKRTKTSHVQSINRWYSRRMAHTQLIPILANDAVNICASIYHNFGTRDSIYEFVYYALKKFEPDLLDIPFAGQSLPMHYVKPYMTVADSKKMPSMVAEAYFDETLILNNLPTLFYKDNFIQSFFYKVERKLKVRLFHRTNKIPISQLNTQIKKRIAMDFACSSHLNEFKTGESTE